jgi:acetyltransferase-like isoleucine patch superfamily enzyme
MSINDYILRIKRAESPGYARLKKLAKALLTFRLPIPRALDPLYRFLVAFRNLRYETAERLSVIFFRYPVLRASCVSVGKRLRMEQLPCIDRNVRVYIGDDVYLSGTLLVGGGRIFPDPEFRVGNGTFIGDKCRFAVARLIEIGDDVLIAGGCSVSDYSGHPVDPQKRIAGVQVDPADVRPVRIGNKVWLGRGAVILPGVTIGEDAVVGAAAVVTKDVPAGHICVGNPGRLLSRTVYDRKPEQLAKVD